MIVKASKHQAQQPSTSCTHKPIWRSRFLPSRRILVLERLSVMLKAQVSKLPSSSLSPKALLGEGLFELFCWGFRVFSRFSLKQRLCLHWWRQNLVPSSGDGWAAFGNGKHRPRGQFQHVTDRQESRVRRIEAFIRLELKTFSLFPCT